MAIIMKDIKKQYPGSHKPVMEHFDLTIEEGSFTVLLGPSGCGKTTALRMIAGLEEVTDGRIYIDETDVTDVDPGDRNIAMVFQNYAIYPHMTVRGNVEFGLKNYQISKEEIDERVKYVLGLTGLTEYADRKPSQLSGGQRQRVALARAISKSPKAFLMDEPLSNLDAKLRNQMRAEIIKLRQRINTTFIYVTHDQTEAMTLGDRIVIMKDGFIQQIGTPQEVFNHPYNLFVATFIGTPQMNLFENAELVKENGKYAVKLEGLTVELSEAKQAALTKNNVAPQPVVLGVRPEHIELSSTGIDAKVDVSEMMGSSVHLHVTAMGRDVVLVVSTMNMTPAEVASLTTGAAVKFDFAGHVCHVFSKETGINLEA